MRRRTHHRLDRGTTRQHRLSRKECPRGRKTRSCCRSWLLQRRGNPRLRQGGNCGDASHADGHQVLRHGGCFGKQDFVYLSDEDAYRCPGWREAELPLHQRRGRAAAPALLDQCMPRLCTLKSQLHNGKERRISRWEHEDVLEEVQRAPRQQSPGHAAACGDVEHPFGTMKARKGGYRMHFLTKTLFQK